MMLRRERSSELRIFSSDMPVGGERSHSRPASRPGRRLSRYAAAGLALWLLPAVSSGVLGTETEQTAQTGILQAGAVTRGGAGPDARIVRVTNLHDSGEGSLRAAVSIDRPRIVVFDVAGTIELKSELRISKPFITVAGQTAPAPGILLRGNKLRISAHDAIVQHISVLPWSADPSGKLDDLDAITIGPCDKCGVLAKNIRIENVSAGWAVDEVIGLWGDTLENVTVRNSIIAEALSHAGHSKGGHSMGMLIGIGVQRVEVVGNLFASNVFRNPVVSSRSSAFVANNFIYNPGEVAMHVYKGPDSKATFVNNAVERGPSSVARLYALDLQDSLRLQSPGAMIFASNNSCCDGEGGKDALQPGGERTLVDSPAIESTQWDILPTDEVRKWVETYAGSRPAERGGRDARIIGYVTQRGGRVIDLPGDVGGFADWPATEKAAETPLRPFDDSSLSGKLRIEAWLCLRHLDVGGPPTHECAESRDQLGQALLD